MDAETGEDERGDDGVAVVDQPARVGIESGGCVEHSGDLPRRPEMWWRRSVDLDPAAPTGGRVVADPPVFDRKGEEPAQHLDRLVDRACRERSHRTAERVAARPALGEATAAVIGLLELVESVGVDGPDVDLRQRPVREEGEQMSECPIPVSGGRGPDFSSALPDLRPGERSERRGVLAATAIIEGRPVPRRRRHPGTALDFRADHLHLFFAAPPGPALLRRAQRQVSPPAVGAEPQGEHLRAAIRPLEDVVLAPFSQRSAPPVEPPPQHEGQRPVRSRPNGIRPLRSGPIGL